ncbi:hypothetical protein BAUCODRAFT_281955 [Baudoinia panamericana UAMH 10762]|uniref:Uncharacterized protein n=1 Tax=Baudoinia panamericana (strain UAMH 10762) TaxID=717646 RepID=M2MZW0_BAUPA|nr:uncharacterized protein BAUCODRAFT_281955 [Baudoinia panamericana UAMH 10762]EMC92214.1 hypothetical protein BAUCODRAFT_281955 [Baudoinia panamericana UAMH 10762]
MSRGNVAALRNETGLFHFSRAHMPRRDSAVEFRERLDSTKPPSFCSIVVRPRAWVQATTRQGFGGHPSRVDRRSNVLVAVPLEELARIQDRPLFARKVVSLSS